ncbi:MAG: ABC transporter ATP-binding protein [Chloroflexota bacterium]|nr:ABC transporter ATP-binding protein [Chloroflexota bacterium]
MSAYISIADVTKFFAGTSGRIDALQNVNLDVPAGEFLCLVGPSGCGKSTLVFIIAGLVKASGGEVRVGGEPVVEPDPDRTMVFQGDAVFPWMTVAQNIGYGLRYSGMPKAKQDETVKQLIHLVGLTGFADAFPKELSGGMKKRVDLARAYATNPTVLLMDEPFGALDAITKEKMQVDLMRLSVTDTGQRRTIVFVTHDLEEAIFLADRVAVMTPRPGSIQVVLDVPFPRPREASIRLSREFQALRGQIRELLVTEEEES